MSRYIVLLCGILMVVSACASKTETPAEDPADALKQSLANYTNVCADVAFSQTIAKLGEVDKYKAEGNDDESVVAAREAIELFKVEEPKYLELNNANEAQYSKLSEVVARRDALSAEVAAISANPNAAANVQKWQEALSVLNQHIDSAKAAYDICDPEKAKAELDAASALLDESAGLVVIVEETVVEAKVYTVKKGDNLWNIAGAEYSNPFMWPIIYWANKAQIKDPDLIFPGQNFDIVFEFAEEEQVRAIEFSKTRGPWSLYDNQ